MTLLTRIEPYSDINGNSIICDQIIEGVKVSFKGSNNTLKIKAGAQLKFLEVMFDCDGGHVEIGSCDIAGKGLRASIRVGQESRIIIGDNVTCTGRCRISALEKSTLTIGNDCMISANNEIRTDDAHPIFDVRTGQRLNMPRDTHVGNHVWLARDAVVLGGSVIGDGTVIGHSAMVKRKIPNNCIAVGSPARVVRRDIAWERPHLSLRKPYYKPDISHLEVKSEAYWNLTQDPEDVAVAPVIEAAPTVQAGGWLQRLRRLLGRG